MQTVFEPPLTFGQLHPGTSGDLGWLIIMAAIVRLSSVCRRGVKRKYFSHVCVCLSLFSKYVLALVKRFRLKTLWPERSLDIDCVRTTTSDTDC